MNRRNSLLTIVLTILVCGTLAAAVGIRKSWAWNGETIYIKPDGSIDPDTAPIQRTDQLYTIADSISSTVNGIVIERDNITLDGAGQIIEGSGSGIGLNLTGLRNVTMSNMRIRQFYHGVLLNGSSTNNITGNEITNNHYGISLYSSTNNNISMNTIANNNGGIRLDSSSSNNFYHNNVIDNTRQVLTYKLTNSWDDGYPSGGNYWSDYISRYPNASEIDDSGMWNTPYAIDPSNMDNYPLKNQYVVPEFDSFIVLALLMAIVLLVTIVCRRENARTRSE